MSDRPLDVGWLRLYEAIGRLENLTRVAEDFRLSQPAVSYQLRKIEEDVGLPLVRRVHRGAELTREGAVLYEAVQAALSSIDDAVRQIRRRGRGTSVRIHTDFGFASYWLMPRISAFRRIEPEVEVHVLASQSMRLDDRGDADLHILFGQRENFGPQSVQLTEEQVAPVCTPGYLARSGPLEAPADLAAKTLIHLEGDVDSRWYSWQEWLQEAGVARRPATGDLSFNAYHLVLQAALAEQGVALGWAGLVDDFLKNGLLVEAGPRRRRRDRGYWLIPPAIEDSRVVKLTEWLVEESRSDTM